MSIRSKRSLSSHNVSFEDRSEPMPISQKRSIVTNKTHVKHFLISEKDEFK